MRRDVYIENDSGALSVIASDAVDAIIDDQRANDDGFVTSYKALLLELHGDDSMPVRIVVDEPLQPEEEAQWLARASWRIDAADGRVLVMGGFDPDVLGWWKDESGGNADGRGVAIVDTPTGSLRVDVYAHAGSMNGRHILGEAGEKVGAAFRRSHPGRPFPLWLANMLEFSGDDDPGHEAIWRNIKESLAAGTLAIDLEGAPAIGFLVHIQPLQGSIGEAPEAGWFPLDANRRVPKVFPIGLPSGAAHPNLDSFRDKLLGREREVAPPPPATKMVEILESWSGDAPQAIAGNTPPIEIELANAYWLYWMAALTADSPPPFEFWIDGADAWPVPAATPEYAVATKTGGVIAIGASVDNGGWWLLWGARKAAATFAGLPDGATIDLGMTPPKPDDEDDEDEWNPAIGRAFYNGTVHQGRWQLAQCSPAVDRTTLAEAIDFLSNMVTGRYLRLRSEEERQAVVTAAGIYSPEEGSVTWDNDGVHVNDADDRTLIMLAGPAFRVRYGRIWPCDKDEEW